MDGHIWLIIFLNKYCICHISFSYCALQKHLITPKFDRYDRKKILTCLLAVVLASTLTSFNNRASTPVTKETSFSVVTLYKRVVISGVAYNVYVDYDTVLNQMIWAKVYLDDCTECVVVDMGNVPCTYLGGFNWQVSGAGVGVSTYCNITIPFDGAVVAQLPWCG